MTKYISVHSQTIIRTVVFGEVGMFTIMEQIKTTAQLRFNKVHRFQPKVDLAIDCGPYLLKTAQSTEELIESFKLRHQVFNNEFRGLRGDGLDFDRFDYHFDHLIILHKPSHRIIGTYRLNCTDHNSESYTALEFNIQSLLTKPGPHLELGRACIHHEFRKGSVITLLWRGIAEYMELTDSQSLFGCSSVKIQCGRDAALIYKYLLDLDQVEILPHCEPTKEFQLDDFESWFGFYRKGLTELQRTEAEELIPSLLKTYLKLGAKVVAAPAFDRDFNCVDMLTSLHRRDLANSLADKFRLKR